MRRRAKRFACYVLAFSIVTLPACTHPAYQTDQSAGVQVAPTTITESSPAVSHTPPTGPIGPRESQDLTSFLKGRKLPLVTAQVVDGGDGNRQVILFGFVRTDKGRSNAESYVREYYNQPAIAVDNRIRVAPELASANRSTTEPVEDPYASIQGPDAYAQQMPYDPYGYQYQQQQPSALMTLLPLLGLIMGFGFGSSGSGFNYYGGYGGFGSGYGYPNYYPPPPPPGLSPYGP